ncbi:MAG: hypothetical protein WKG07_23170 [Hymenobacter sp.]
MRFLPLLLFLLLAAGCQCRGRAARSRHSALLPRRLLARPQADTTNVGRLPWRQYFRDSALVGLLDTALGQNLICALPCSGVEIYQAQYLARRGALFPTRIGRGQRRGSTTSGGTPDGGREFRHQPLAEH